MGSLFRSEEVCLAQLFLQSASAYSCVSELGEMGLVEFRDLNPNVNAFQRKFVGDVRRCEEMEKTFTFLEQEIRRAGPSVLPPVSPEALASSTAAPSPRDALRIQEESERLSLELREVSRNRDSLQKQLREALEYQSVLRESQRFTERPESGSPLSDPLSAVDGYQSFPQRMDVHLSFTAGIIHPWKVNSLERLLWRACRGYVIFNFKEMDQPMEDPATGEMVRWVVFLVSYWGDQIGQKVKKICDCYHSRVYPYPQSDEERHEILQGLETRIQETKSVLRETEDFLRQVLLKAVQSLPGWSVQVQKSKAIYLVLNMCSVSVTDKCLIAEVWCAVRELPRLTQALREGSVSLCVCLSVCLSVRRGGVVCSEGAAQTDAGPAGGVGESVCLSVCLSVCPSRGCGVQ
ncbi:V-type proton ATPase 116 kDa subunit a 2-like [Acipenser ruthenus]|uniref:V-type proton ATPase 116 kDa subunit a 2-like n=1 Tax=Acipenser ruthenus TaxID=7906 RepID=UPI0027422CF7|nr:V-type proton ATPase 116 kDa subunit a 2-like [Acipenser ruthenus]